MHDPGLDGTELSATRARAARVVMAIVTLWLASAAALDRIGDGDTLRTHYDAIVVAGAGVLENGEPSRPLAARVDLAARLFREGRAPRIVMTGGIGTHPPAEAEVGARRARELGVPASAILLESRSTSTEENAAFAAAMIGRDARILLVTDRFHVFRARRVFARRFDHVHAVGCVSHPWPRFRGAVREVVAVASYALLGRL